jgi:RNA polymerase sigma-70 factor, ECF subfamily
VHAEPDYLRTLTAVIAPAGGKLSGRAVHTAPLPGGLARLRIPALVALLREDALLTMPPFPLAYRGREAIAQFLATVPADGHLDQITLVPARANLQPAVAAYIGGPGSCRATAYGIMVLTIDGSTIGEITGFADPALFSFFGLPSPLEA